MGRDHEVLGSEMLVGILMEFRTEGGRAVVPDREITRLFA